MENFIANQRIVSFFKEFEMVKEIVMETQTNIDNEIGNCYYNQTLSSEKVIEHEKVTLKLKEEAITKVKGYIHTLTSLIESLNTTIEKEEFNIFMTNEIFVNSDNYRDDSQSLNDHSVDETNSIDNVGDNFQKLQHSIISEKVTCNNSNSTQVSDSNDNVTEYRINENDINKYDVVDEMVQVCQENNGCEYEYYEYEINDEESKDQQLYDNQEQNMLLQSYLPVLQQWSGLSDVSVLFDSDLDEELNEVFNSRIIGTSNIFIIIFDEHEFVFGTYLQKMEKIINNGFDGNGFNFVLQNNQQQPTRWLKNNGTNLNIQLYDSGELLFTIRINDDYYAIAKTQCNNQCCCNLSHEFNTMTNMNINSEDVKLPSMNNFNIKRILLIKMDVDNTLQTILSYNPILKDWCSLQHTEVIFDSEMYDITTLNSTLIEHNNMYIICIDEFSNTFGLFIQNFDGQQSMLNKTNHFIFSLNLFHKESKKWELKEGMNITFVIFNDSDCLFALTHQVSKSGFIIYKPFVSSSFCCSLSHCYDSFIDGEMNGFPTSPETQMIPFSIERLIVIEMK
ncbi:TLDc domain-containing protein [Entamoeba marina]